MDGQAGRCSLGCGGGSKQRLFTITKPALYGGATCEGPANELEYQGYNTEDCPVVFIEQTLDTGLIGLFSLLLSVLLV